MISDVTLKTDVTAAKNSALLSQEYILNIKRSNFKLIFHIIAVFTVCLIK